MKEIKKKKEKKHQEKYHTGYKGQGEGEPRERDYGVTVRIPICIGSQVPSPLQGLEVCGVSTCQEWKTVFVLCHG